MYAILLYYKAIIIMFADNAKMMQYNLGVQIYCLLTEHNTYKLTFFLIT